MSITYGALWYKDQNLFTKSKNMNHKILMLNIHNICKNRKEDFLQHFFTNYEEDLPPSWMIMECLSFGTVSYIYKNLRTMRDKKMISKTLGFPPTILESWIESLVFTRNICAHHARLWNRWFLFRPKLQNNSSPLRAESAHTIYEQIQIISLLTKSTHTLWLKELYQLMKKYPTVSKMKMGFTSDWQKDPVWGLKSVTYSQDNVKMKATQQEILHLV